MCRSIKPLFNFDPPTAPTEIEAAALQFVRKISGFTKPSRANQANFLRAVEEIAAASSRLLLSLETNAAPKSRDAEAAKTLTRTTRRFAAVSGTPEHSDHYTHDTAPPVDRGPV